MLTVGTKLGPYEIIGSLGAGGMGEVYRARDHRLGRDLALKVLPASFSTNVEWLQRFEQEARAAAALNHPNILVVFDVGTHEHGPFLACELLEGETLRELLARGRLSSRRATEYAVQIARGLAAAHQRGIVHRDLKPENVFVTTDGRIKILDFGLAKVEPEVAADLATAAPTMVPTTPGVVLGTVGYMSPEQVRGVRADHRADIFALGVVLYELLSGRRAFARPSAVETMAAIVNEEPPPFDLSDGPADRMLDRVVRRCLEKNPAARFQSAEDLAFALEGPWAGIDKPIPAATTPRRGWIRRAWPVAAAAVAGLVVAGTMLFARRPPTTEARLTRMTVSPPEGWRLALTSQAIPIAVSPDGRYVAGRARDEQGRRVAIWVRALDSLQSRLLPGTEGVAGLFWSPDSKSLGFVARKRLWKTDIAGGAPVALTEWPGSGVFGLWNWNGLIQGGGHSVDRDSGVMKVSAAGGQPVRVTSLGPGESFHSLVVPLPDGDQFFFVASPESGSFGKRQLYVASSSSSERRLVFDAQRYVTPVAVALDHFLYLRGRALMAQPFDTATLSLSGDALLLVDSVQLLQDRPYGMVSATAGGVLAYVPDPQASSHQLAWYDRSGRQSALVGSSGNYSGIELAPDDGRALVIAKQPDSGTRDVWMLDLTRGTRTRVTSHRAEERRALWSSDGRRILFSGQRDGPAADLFVKSADGAAMEAAVLDDTRDKDPLTWSADGRLLLYHVGDVASRRDIWVLPVSGDRVPFPWLQSPAAENHAQFSPDGKWVAYTSTEPGQAEVFVTPFPGPGRTWQVSAEGGSFARWRHDGRELFYLAPDRTLMSAQVETMGADFKASSPQTLFQAPVVRGANIGEGHPYAVTRDGQRFLVNTTTSPEPSVVVVVGWPSLLKK